MVELACCLAACVTVLRMPVLLLIRRVLFGLDGPTLLAGSTWPGDGAPPRPRSFCFSIVITRNVPTQTTSLVDSAGGGRRPHYHARDTIARSKRLTRTPLRLLPAPSNF
eukprot:178245-Pleurochrysis_carterae.AAC.1